MKNTKRCALGGLILGALIGACWGLFDDSEPAPILSPGIIALMLAGPLAILGFWVGFIVGAFIDSFSPPDSGDGSTHIDNSPHR